MTLLDRLAELERDTSDRKRADGDATAWRKRFALRAAAQLGQPAEVIERADAGDPKAQALVLASLDAGGAELVATEGSFTLRAEEALLDATSAASWSLKEARRRSLRALRDEIAGPKPTALEAALAHALAMSLVEAEHLATLAHRGNTSESLDRRRSRAHWRAMSAARHLALVRRLALVPVQPLPEGEFSAAASVTVRPARRTARRIGGPRRTRSRLRSQRPSRP